MDCGWSLRSSREAAEWPIAVAVELEHAVGREQAQHPAKGVGVGADDRREVAGGAGRRIQRVGDAELGDDVQAARQGIAARVQLAGGFRRLIALPGSARPALLVTCAAGRPRRVPLVADRRGLIARTGSAGPAVIIARARDGRRDRRHSDRLAPARQQAQTVAEWRGGQAQAERQDGDDGQRDQQVHACCGQVRHSVYVRHVVFLVMVFVTRILCLCVAIEPHT